MKPALVAGDVVTIERDDITAMGVVAAFKPEEAPMLVHMLVHWIIAPPIHFERCWCLACNKGYTKKIGHVEGWE